ncbi:MAG TPA: hypothetical protein VFQ61_28140 [Polyangiaceae bacterium]|nr:hypothetical protein [Polyangiaceae bacterium]
MTRAGFLAPSALLANPARTWRPFARKSSVLLGVFLLASTVTAQRGESPEALLRRYPFDPACPFGRISNGKGMIVRCIEEREATGLLQQSAGQPTPALSAHAGSSQQSPGQGPAPGARDEGTPALSSTTPSTTNPPAETEPVEAPGSDRFDVVVGPVAADQGDLPLGKLGQAKSRYAKCLADNGGLRDKSAEVQVRFLVRSKGIAEGVSVQKRIGVSAEAARCVAEVVDRRRVGTPSAPMVGASVTIRFEKTGK